MAQLTSGIQFTGSLGNVSAYRMKGSDKIVLRTKGGPSKKQVASGKQFEITRRNNSEFSRRSKGGAIILRAMHALRPLADHKISAPLNGILKQIQVLDTTSVFGERDIFLSRKPGLLEGFSFNREHTFDSTLMAPVQISVDEASNSVSVVIPEIVYGTNFRTSNRHPYCQFVVNAACVPDLVWRDHGYHANVITNTSRTEWRPVTAQSDEQQMQLPYVLPSTEPSTLLVGIGVQYGTVSPYGEIVPVNYGCAKVLLSRSIGQGRK